MILGIMQPYFFPYLGYFDHINRCDRWVVFDIVDFQPRSWMNRNRVLHPTEGWQYIIVPVDRHAHGPLLSDVAVVDMQAAHRRIRGQIQHYRVRKAPYFSSVARMIDDCFEGCSGNRLRDLNVRSLALACRYLGIGFDPALQSDASYQLPPIEHPGQWALEISSALGADEYLNPSGGRDLFRLEEFAERGIRLSFTEPLDAADPTNAAPTIAGLSIIDVLMWCEPGTVKAYLDKRKQNRPVIRP